MLELTSASSPHFSSCTMGRGAQLTLFVPLSLTPFICFAFAAPARTQYHTPHLCIEDAGIALYKECTATGLSQQLVGGTGKSRQFGQCRDVFRCQHQVQCRCTHWLQTLMQHQTPRPSWLECRQADLGATPLVPHLHPPYAPEYGGSEALLSHLWKTDVCHHNHQLCICARGVATKKPLILK